MQHVEEARLSLQLPLDLSIVRYARLQILRGNLRGGHMTGPVKRVQRPSGEGSQPLEGRGQVLLHALVGQNLERGATIQGCLQQFPALDEAGLINPKHLARR